MFRLPLVLVLLALLLCTAPALASEPTPERAILDPSPSPSPVPLDIAPDPTPAPEVVSPQAPAWDYGPVLSPEVWLWAEEDCAYYGTNCRMAHAILGGESKHSRHVPCGDGGASCGPGQIQAGFQTALHNAYPQTRGWSRLVPRDNVRMVVFSVAATEWGDWRFVQAWSAYWVNWVGRCPPWWSAAFCSAYWRAH